MKFERLECVVLVRDIPEHGLRAGDVGVVVEVYPGGGLEVEFVTGSGMTQAVLTVGERDVRSMDSHDLLTTRHVSAIA